MLLPQPYKDLVAVAAGLGTLALCAAIVVIG